jgi:hypothetical protein
MSKKIYLATSWKNPHYYGVYKTLLKAGHTVYDFRREGFGWESTDPNWKEKFDDFEAYMNALVSQTAVDGFLRDFGAMEWADTGVLLTPCGRSAHLELGWMVGKKKPCYILLTEPQEWELMYLLADKIVNSTDALLDLLKA